MSDWVVVLAGGVGSRFWPLSTPERPKQLLPLVGAQPLLVDALERVRPLADLEHTLVLTNASLADAVAEVLPALPRENIIAEPKPSGTAAALAWAAHQIAERAGGDAVMISVHADWAVGDPETFRGTLRKAADVARRHRGLVTVGIVPTRPDTGFGYIHTGDEVEPGVMRVKAFVEKPDRERAMAMVYRGRNLWNSGIFVWRVDDFLGEINSRTPEIAPALAMHGDSIGDFFNAVKTPVSVDVGVLERSGRVLVLPGDFGWDDVGTWGALRRVRARDAAENATSGEAHVVDGRGNVVHAEQGRVVLYGVNDVVVVVREGLVLVTTVEKSSDLKTLLEALPPDVRERE